MTEQSHNADSATKTYDLWISSNWFIPVDEEGRCVSDSAEGALGFVIKLHHRERNRHLALKIPRLLGDTHRENAYISQLMEQELSAVKSVNSTSNPVPTGNLLNAQPELNFLREPINTSSGISLANEWDKALIFVRFEKGTRPRFCLIAPHSDPQQPPRRFPPSIKDAPISDSNTLKQCVESSYKAFHNENFRKPGDKEELLPYQGTVFIETTQGQAAPAVFSVGDALERNPTGVVWYTCLPSVVYGWAPMTLQEAISSVSNSRGEWSVRQHLDLMEGICQGIAALHARGTLHADIRPANIVVQGDQKDPYSYKITDYGGFAQTDIGVPERFPGGVSATRMPVVSGERVSAFYAPERRLGREREAADAAVIINDEGGARLKIVLGWKRDLVKDGEPNRTVIEDWLKRSLPLKDEYQDEALRAGDRIQVRDFIFELDEDERRIEDKQIFFCDRRCWQLYHGRIAILYAEPFKDWTWIPIPRTVELLKWSAATDLYSMGALLLYSIFRSKPPKVDDAAFLANALNKPTGDKKLTEDGEQLDQTNVEYVQSHDENAVGTKHTDVITEGGKVEDEFREMLTFLTSQPYFDAIWLELDWLRHRIEEELQSRKGHSPKEFEIVGFTRHDRSPEDTKREENEPENLRAAAVDITKRLTQTAPGVYRLVEALDYNLAEFIFVMHFALACLNRGNHLRKDTMARAKQSWHIEGPFCAHRGISPEGEQGRDDEPPAVKALKRIRTIRELINNPLLKVIHPEKKDEIKPYDPRPDVSIRIERDRLERQVINLEAQKILLETEKSDRIVEQDELTRKNITLQEENGKMRMEWDGLNNKFAAAEEQNAGLVVRLSSLESKVREDEELITWIDDRISECKLGINEAFNLAINAQDFAGFVSKAKMQAVIARLKALKESLSDEETNDI